MTANRAYDYRCPHCDAVSTYAPGVPPAAKPPQSALARSLAIALLTREVLCEAVYRRRDAWNATHPNRALCLRNIDLSVVVDHVEDQHVLALDKEALRAFAAIVLDLASE